MPKKRKKAAKKTKKKSKKKAKKKNIIYRIKKVFYTILTTNY
jgi:hypothetical protein